MIGTIRRECLDHMIIFNDRQLHRILEEFLDHYHRVRPHKSLEDDSPDGGEIEDDEERKAYRFRRLVDCLTTIRGKRFRTGPFS